LLLSPAAAEQVDPPWRLAIQAYTFRQKTFFETLDILQKMGVRYVEAYPAQTIGGGLDGTTHFTMPADVRAKVKAKLEAAGVSLTAYGVVKAKTADEWRVIFEFAKDMGIQSLTAEPTLEQLDDVEKLAKEFAIPVALHNHPKSSPANVYWGPEQVLEACKGRSKLIGACADTGHWVRSGLVAADALKALEGRIIALHLKDLRDGTDVPWGAGDSDFPAQIVELNRQGFKGTISIEYEHITDDLVDNVAACVAAYHRVNGSLALHNGSPVKFVMTDDPSAVFVRIPQGVAGTWPAKPGGSSASSGRKPLRPRKVRRDPSWDGPDHKEPYRTKTDTLALNACGKGFETEWAEKAFDGDPKTKWCIAQPTIWVEWSFNNGKAREVTKYAIVSANDDPNRDPKDWQLLGSADGEKWTVVDERKNQRFPERHHRLAFDVKTPGAYPHYKLDVTKNAGDPRTQLGEIEFE